MEKRSIIIGSILGLLCYFLCNLIGYIFVLTKILDAPWKILSLHLLCLALAMWVTYYKAESAAQIAIRVCIEFLSMAGVTCILAYTGITKHVMDELLHLSTGSQYVHGMLMISTFLFLFIGNVSALVLFLIKKNVKKFGHKD